MAWQTPKQDWKAGDVPTASDFNRIEENTQELQDNKVPTTRKVAGKALSADVTLAKGDVGLGSVDNYRQARSAEGYTIVKNGTDGAGIINFKTE